MIDRTDERVLQEGLDFTPALQEGFFNDNHGKSSLDVLGYPTDARLLEEGEPLPDGSGELAPTRCWWVEGHLIDDEAGRKLFDKIKALAKTDRRLGFSIQGPPPVRDPIRNEVVRARVDQIAITYCPASYGTEVRALAKALSAGGAGSVLEPESLEKAAAGSPRELTEREHVAAWAAAFRSEVAADADAGLSKGLDPTEALIVAEHQMRGAPYRDRRAAVIAASRRVQ